jgi:hypothetical protein
LPQVRWQIRNPFRGNAKRIAPALFEASAIPDYGGDVEWFYIRELEAWLLLCDQRSAAHVADPTQIMEKAVHIGISPSFRLMELHVDVERRHVLETL